MKKAIAYASDIILGRTGEVITRTYQKDLITRYAAENGIEITAWFEDEMYHEDLLSRPGVKAMLSTEIDHDLVLVERIWTFSRNWPKLEGLFSKLDAKNVKLESTTLMWDCVSQMSRRHYDSSLSKVGCAGETVTADDATVKVRKPERLNFVSLKKAPVPA